MVIRCGIDWLQRWHIQGVVVGIIEVHATQIAIKVDESGVIYDLEEANGVDVVGVVGVFHGCLERRRAMRAEQRRQSKMVVVVEQAKSGLGNALLLFGSSRTDQNIRSSARSCLSSS